MIPPWIWEEHCPLVINIYKTRMPSDTLLTEEKKKAEYIGRQLRISLFAATGTPTQPFVPEMGTFFAAWLQLFSLLQFPMDRLDFSGLSLRTFPILSYSLPPLYIALLVARIVTAVHNLSYCSVLALWMIYKSL